MKTQSRLFIVAWLTCLLCSTASAQTPPPAPTVTLSARQAIDLTATQIVARYEATAAAYPLTEAQVEGFGAFVFLLAFGSLLIVFVPLAFAVWWMNRQK